MKKYFSFVLALSLALVSSAAMAALKNTSYQVAVHNGQVQGVVVNQGDDSLTSTQLNLKDIPSHKGLPYTIELSSTQQTLVYVTESNDTNKGCLFVFSPVSGGPSNGNGFATLTSTSLATYSECDADANAGLKVLVAPGL